MDVPYAPSEESVAQVAEQLRAMAAFVQAHGGRPLEEDALRAAVARSRATVEGYHRYLSLRAERSLSDEMTSEMLSVFATHSMLGSPEALRYTEQLCAQVAAPCRRGGVESGFCGCTPSPHWQDSLRALLNFRPDVEIVGCDMALDADVLPEPERPYASPMARRLVCSSFNGGAERRAGRGQRSWPASSGPTGAVYFCHWGCKQTSGAAQLVKRRLEAAGFPTLVLDGDGCDSGNVDRRPDGHPGSRPFWSCWRMQVIGYPVNTPPWSCWPPWAASRPFSTGRLTPSPTPRR